jgi:hypothetical protein
MNISTRVGFQTPFSNITMDITCPKALAKEAVVVGGEPRNEVYGDFQPEMDMINRAFAEVMMEGDSEGRVFTFPIPTYNIGKDFDWDDITHGNRPPMYVIHKMAAALRADWMEDERMAAEFVKMVMDTRVFFDAAEPEAAAAAEEEDSCAIHGPLYGDDICAGCHYDSCRPPTKEEMEHWHSHESAAEEGGAAAAPQTTCWGCREGQPNQLAHTDPGGCLYSEEDAF